MSALPKLLPNPAVDFSDPVLGRRERKMAEQALGDHAELIRETSRMMGNRVRGLVLAAERLERMQSVDGESIDELVKDHLRKDAAYLRAVARDIENKRVDRWPNMRRRNLFGFGRKEKGPACTSRKSDLNLGDALIEAKKAGARAGDTAEFEHWLVRTGLCHRSKDLQKRLKVEFHAGVEEGEAPVKKPKTRYQRYKHWHLWQEGKVWRTDRDPLTAFEDKTQVKRFLDDEAKMRRSNPKPVSEMSAGEINRELDKLDRLGSALNDELIAAGRGYERSSETQTKSDPLSQRYKALLDRRMDLRYEIERRYGPGAPSRLPLHGKVKFGPIRMHNPQPGDGLYTGSSAAAYDIGLAEGAAYVGATPEDGVVARLVAQHRYSAAEAEAYVAGLEEALEARGIHQNPRYEFYYHDPAIGRTQEVIRDFSDMREAESFAAELARKLGAEVEMDWAHGSRRDFTGFGISKRVHGGHKTFDKSGRLIKENPHFPGRLGSGSRFAACVRDVRARGTADDPRAVCAAIGRAKYGKARFQAMAQAGKRRSNSAAASSPFYTVIATGNAKYAIATSTSQARDIARRFQEQYGGASIWAGDELVERTAHNPGEGIYGRPGGYRTALYTAGPGYAPIDHAGPFDTLDRARQWAQEVIGTNRRHSKWVVKITGPDGALVEEIGFGDRKSNPRYYSIDFPPGFREWADEMYGWDDSDFSDLENESVRTLKDTSYESQGFHRFYGRFPRNGLEFHIGRFLAHGTKGSLYPEVWAKLKDWRPRKRNPESSAASLYESFHGAPSTETLVIEEEIHEHDHLATLGDLVELTVATPTDLKATISFDRDEPKLASSEDGRTLYVAGGDQSLDLHALKMDGDKWVKDLMVIGDVLEVVYRAKKSFDDMQELEYQHKVAEISGEHPVLLYDPISEKLSFAGGKYFIKQPLVGVSPGIED